MSNWNRKASIGGLIITRKEGEKVVINQGELVLEVMQIRGKTVKLVFAATKDISIRRGESIEGSNHAKNKTDKGV